MNYKMVDSDNHYYEAEGTFTRYGDEGVRKFVRWVSDGRRRHILFGTKMSTSLPNPTFSPIAKPGAFHARLTDLEQGFGDRVLSLPTDRMRYGELEPIPDYYRDHEARLVVMDGQNLERCILFPTLGVRMKGLMSDNVEMAYSVFHAFNRWIEEDWGFSYLDRLYGASRIPMLDPTLATENSKPCWAAVPG